MNELSGLVALAVGLIFFGVYSYRLGIAPTFSHDDYDGGAGPLFHERAAALPLGFKGAGRALQEPAVRS
jgi:hypothetical protein